MLELYRALDYSRRPWDPAILREARWQTYF